jgi:YVTN family beta-propeller protein
MSRSANLFLVASLLACASSAPRPRPLEALRDEGELHVYVQRLPPESGRLSIGVKSVAARAPAGDAALTLALATLSGAELQHQRLLATGRLPPGKYEGLTLDLSGAEVRTPTGTAALVVPKEGARVEVPFVIESRRATILWLSLKYPRSQDDDFSLPALSAHVPAMPAPEILGYCANPGSASLTLFDKLTQQVAAVLPTGTAPTGIALDRVQNRMYVALQRDDAVDVVDATSGNQVGRIALRSGDDPRGLALVRGGSLLLVVNEGSDSLSFVDPVTSAEIGRVRTGEQPWSVLPDRSEARAYVVNRRSNTVTVIDLATLLVVGTIATEPEPLWATLDRLGTRLHVVHGGSLYMTVYRLPGLALERRVFVGAPASFVKIDARTDLIYVAIGDEPRVQVYDPFSFIPLNAIPVPGPVSYMAIDDVENAMFLLMRRRRSIAVLNLTSRKTLGVMDVGLDPHELALAGERD